MYSFNTMEAHVPPRRTRPSESVSQTSGVPGRLRAELVTGALRQVPPTLLGQSLLHHRRAFAVIVIPLPVLHDGVSAAPVKLMGAMVGAPQCEADDGHPQRTLTGFKERSPDAASAVVWMDPDGGDPANALTSTAVPDDEPDRSPAAHRFQAHGLRERKCRQNIDPRPCITTEADLLQRDDLPQVAPRRFFNLQDRTGLGIGQKLLLTAAKILEQAGEFHGEDVLRGWADPHGFQRVEVLQCHGLLVDGLRHAVDLFQGG